MAVPESESDPFAAAAEHFPSFRRKVPRCKTAPAMTVMKEYSYPGSQISPPSSSLVLRQEALLLLLYLSIGVAIYSFNHRHFSGTETHLVVDALYFCIVTMCTIGYGDIAPLTHAAKLFACAFVLVGFEC